MMTTFLNRCCMMMMTLLVMMETSRLIMMQVYVALSRCAAWDRIRVLLRNGNVFIRNLVHAHLIV